MSSDGTILLKHQWEVARNHDAELFPALDECMKLLGNASLDLIIVGAGPGSYGGVRVALAASVGISVVKGCPVVALDSWEQLSEAASRWIISDAKRGGWTLRHPDGLIEVATLEQVQQLLSDAKTLVSVESSELLSKHALVLSATDLRPTALGLIESWNRLSSTQQALLIATPPAPIYVRQPHITKAKRKPWECG